MGSRRKTGLHPHQGHQADGIHDRKTKGVPGGCYLGVLPTPHGPAPCDPRQLLGASSGDTHPWPCCGRGPGSEVNLVAECVPTRQAQAGTPRRSPAPSGPLRRPRAGARVLESHCRGVAPPVAGEATKRPRPRFPHMKAPARAPAFGKHEPSSPRRLSQPRGLI